MKKINLIEWLWKTDSHEKQKPQRFARYAAMLIMLLTLGVGQMWAADVKQNTMIYLDNSASNWSYSNIYFVINDNNGYPMSAITNTKLYVHKRSAGSWSGYEKVRFAAFSSSWGGDDASMGGWQNMWDNCQNITDKYDNYTFNGDNLYAIKLSKTGDKYSMASLSVSHIGSSYTSLNKTITVKAKVSTNNGGSYSETTSPATLTASSNKFSDYKTCGTGTSLSSGTIVCGYTATTTLTAPTTDPSGYKFVGWYDSDGNQKTTSKTLTISPTANATYYAYYRKLYTISAGTTVVWDLCGNEKSWSAVYLYKDIEGGSTSNDAMTQCGSTTQYRKTYADAVNNIKVWLFRAQNGSTWSDYMQTTDIYRDASGVTLYEFAPVSYTGTKLDWQVTTGAKKATSGTKVYFDNTATNWSEVWLKYGTTRFNRHSGAAATKVTGTDNLYVITMPEAYYVKWYFADAYGYTNRNSIETMTSINNRIGYQTTDLTSDITYIPSTGSGTPKVWNTTTFSGHTRRLTFGDHSNGNITVRYTDESGTEQTVSSSSASYVDVAQTCKVIITAVPNSGYAPSGLTLGGGAITSGAQQIIRADGTIVATFVAEETHDVTVSYKIGSRTLHADQTFEVGVTTASNISSEEIDGFSFSSWSNLSSDIVNNTGNLTTDPININTTVDGSDCAMTCNYTQWPCSLDVVASSGSTGYSSRLAMTYDATEKAYYKEFTTTAATQYFRFYINSKKYAPSSDTEVPIDGTQVTAATDVTGYSSNMPSVYFNDGGSGSKIKVWFDYEAKKAWVEEVKYTVTIASGGNGTVSPTSVSVGNVVASGTITATASDHYHWSSWTVPSGATIATGTGTKSITIKATAAVTVTANFAGDQYTITYRDKGDVAFSGSQTTPPTTHTYGTATSLKIPTKTGYDFDGWFTASDCASGAVGTSSAASLGATAFTANITLYAKWSAKSYSTSNNIKHSDENNAGTYTATYDATSIALNTTPSKTGYNITNYYKENTFTTLIANTDLSLTSATTTYTSGGKWIYTSAPDLYVKWTAKTYTADNNLDKNGGDSHGKYTATYDATSIAINTTPAKTGYHVEGFYDDDEYSNKVATDAGALQASTSYTDASSHWTNDGNVTLYTKWTANTYQVHFNGNTNTGGSMSNETGFTYDVAKALTANGFTKTGYDFAGWATSAGGSVEYDDQEEVSNLTATNSGTAELYAKWTAKSYTVGLDIDEDHHGTIDGKDTEASVTYDAAPTAIAAAKLPTAANGYCFMGFFTASGGSGVKIINADGTWVSNETGYMSSGNWVYADNTTLYAYYKKAELTALVLSPSTQAPEETVTATPTISPTPTGTVKLCWKILRANGNLLTDDGFSSAGGNAVSFKAPSASGSYKVACVLRTGDACNAGTVLDSIVADLVVAGEHTVTVRYQDSDGRTLAASTEVTGRPLTWTETDIKAPTITGYTFHHWAAGDGVSLSKDGTNALNKDTAQLDSIFIKATYEGTLTAVYNKRRMVYFNNTLGWSSVYVYFYSDATAWDDSDNGQGTSSKRGSGAKTDKIYNGSTYPYSAGHHGEMQNIAGTNIWYFDMATAGYSDCANITFTKDDQHGYEYFSNTEIVRVTNAPYNSTTLPMYVPIPGVKEEHNKLSDGKKAVYYTKGYWMNYPNNTGYWLKIFNKIAKANEEDSAPVCIQDIPFEYTGDMTMPMTVTAELDESVTYGFKIYRSDAVWFGNTGTMKSGASGDTGETAWEFTNGASSNCGLKTSIAGEYKFTLNYAPKSGTYYYLVGVHYPVAANDYRIVYKDQATWSQGTAHSASWYHPSRAIHKENGAEDIVSFYVSKADGASASMKFQKASSISNEGVVTWADSTGGSIDLTGITKSGVYNFYLTQANGVISVSKIEPYEGNYYIRTDCAGSTKWDNYRAKDHQMTYTEFSSSPSTNEFGDLYTHYYMHWCPRETNVKFVIANDYSMCITDTLTQDVGDTYSNITSGGFLKSQKGEGKTEEQDKYSANIRFMYNESTNVITRAYMSSSTEAARKFLVLRSNAKFTDDGKTLNGTGEVSDDVNNIYEAIFLDDQDWIYERKVKVKPGSKFKLYASYAQATAQEDGSQHFRGAYDSNDWTKAANYVELIGGSGDSCIVRVVYDFKTNRLMSAYVPSEDAISGTMSINADIMLVRDHQEAGQQLTFANAKSALTDVKTVYGVMRFNRWILNNRQHPEDHDKEHSKTPALINEHHPLIDNPGDLKSSSERGLYWISFPFDVKLSEVFGFGTYGTDWVFMSYNGAERARSGYWKDSEGFWEYIWDRQDTVLAAGHGIVLALDLDRMGAANTSFWKNEIQQIELFFPSMSSTTGTIKQTDAEVTLASYQCSIDRRTDKSVADINKDRRIADSHWNLLGVPSYANYNEELTDGSSDITWNSNPTTQDLPFLYEWNANDNSYTVQSGTTYPFKAMHAYFVQYQGKVHWTLASATPASIVARRTYAERPQNVELRLELSQNEKMIDQTFVKLSNDEEASANFIFGEDMNKEFNSGKANVYTLIENYIPSAGNTLPMSEQTTIIPVGVKLATSGDYTFAIPDGTEGIGVTLIDNETGIRTSLSALDYTINLSAGTYNDRFVLEISPIQQMPTGVELLNGENGANGVRKVLIDGLLYIVKDGRMFDARGAVVK